MWASFRSPDGDYLLSKRCKYTTIFNFATLFGKKHAILARIGKFWKEIIPLRLANR